MYIGTIPDEKGVYVGTIADKKDLTLILMLMKKFCHVLNNRSWMSP